MSKSSIFFSTFKKISFTNPYPVKKTFKFHTNRPDLLKFKENGIMVKLLLMTFLYAGNSLG